MVKNKDLEEILPFPLKVEFNFDMERINNALKDGVDDIMEEHNKNYDSKVQDIIYHMVDFEDNDYNLEWNEFVVSVGNEIVFRGFVSDEFDDSEGNIDFYEIIFSVIEKVLGEHHDKIIEQQIRNAEKLEELEKERYDEILYAHYALEHDARAFIYLKRLAKRYPNSWYRKRLRRGYLIGNYGIKKNLKIANKMTNCRREKYF